MFINEAALDSKKKEKLDDSEFGIPSLRAFPLNDEQHIIKAIQLFPHAKPSQKEELAKNIAKKIIEKNLVGKVCIKPENKNVEYFPKWMIKGNESMLEKNENSYSIYIDGELYEKGLLESYSPDIEILL